MSDDAKFGTGAVIVGILGCFLLCGGCNYLKTVQVSEGFRDGTIQKFSHKGIIWKTWEGEMAQDGIKQKGENGVTSVWEFSVTDPKIVEEIQKLPSGTKVRLHYVQFMAATWSEGSTSYRVTKVELLRNER